MQSEPFVAVTNYDGILPFSDGSLDFSFYKLPELWWFLCGRKFYG